MSLAVMGGAALPCAAMDPAQPERRVATALRFVAVVALGLAGLHAGNNPDTLGHARVPRIRDGPRTRVRSLDPLRRRVSVAERAVARRRPRAVPRPTLATPLHGHGVRCDGVADRLGTLAGRAAPSPKGDRTRAHRGLRVPSDAAGWSVFRRADARLRTLPDVARDIPAVAALHAIVLATLCEPDRADDALARSVAFHPEPSRETTLAAQEIAIRRGGREGVRELVEAGLRMPEGRDDPWLLALREATLRTPACPP